MTRAAELPPDSSLLLMLMVDALSEHQGPDAAAEDARLRQQWLASEGLEQARVLAAVARDSADRPPPRADGGPAGEYARWLHRRAQVLADPTPPPVPNTGAALGAALLLLDCVRGGRDRPGHTGPAPQEEGCEGK
ncbi:hypothetical protein [Streptomyces iconiensis]|uniref:Uncharacterized protein n=1 Tax=Streptomyces iconiensis TaxID=1384038 RepID=A0ABT6ZRV1_9ACTN|nr:hypothetical protein [Streptomyces iconiensis]MDJ1131776.1 hypothetical protein [Streptomyces iconiensis]